MGNMSEHEKMPREWMRATPGGPLSHELAAQALDVALSSARDAALDEAASAADSAAVSDNRTIQQRAASARANSIAERIRAMKSRPTERYLPESKVREVLATYAENDNTGVVAAIAASLGVDLDAKGEEACPKCHHPTGQHDPKGACGADHCACNGCAP